MTTQYLSHVTLETLENYRNAAARSVVACRSGGRRLIGAVNGALEQRVYPRTAKLAPRATQFMNEVRGNVTQIVIKGLDQTAARAATAIEFGANTAGTQVNKLVRFAAKVDSPVVGPGRQTAARSLVRRPLADPTAYDSPADPVAQIPGHAVAYSFHATPSRDRGLPAIADATCSTARSSRSRVVRG